MKKGATNLDERFFPNGKKRKNKPIASIASSHPEARRGTSHTTMSRPKNVETKPLDAQQIACST
jgi:hypothetical protein